MGLGPIAPKHGRKQHEHDVPRVARRSCCKVLESWRSILAGVRPRAFRIDLDDVRVWANDNSGFVTCVEVIDADDSMGR